jgi:hypothetical protein
MPLLISGSQKNSSAPGGYTNIVSAQNQLGPTPTTSTGFTLVATSGSLVTYVSSLGNLQFNEGTVYSNINNQHIKFIGTGTGTVIVTGPQLNISTSTGVLVVQGGIGISEGLYTGKDINVNGLTIGQGYKGVNNIVITGVATTTNAADFDGENSIAIGWSALSDIKSSQSSIAIGRYALSTGSNLTNTIGIGDGSLKKVGTASSKLVGSITAISTGSTTVITVINHNLTTGSSITINGITGNLGSNLNGNSYLINVLSNNTLSLYNFAPGESFAIADNSIYSLVIGVNTPVNSSSFGSGTITTATLYRNIVTYSNIAIGTDAGSSFYNGRHNFFVGSGAAPKFTTGSFNFFIGYDVNPEMIYGNNNISINSKVITDGDDQIGIGSVFYYDGLDLTTLGSNLLLGDTNTDNEATGPFNSTGALRVYGGAGIKNSLYVGNKLNVTGTGTVTLSPTSSGTVVIYPSTSTGNIDNMIIGAYNAQTSTFFSTILKSAIDSTSETTGALQIINGGAGIKKSLYVGLKIDADTVNIRSSQISTSTTTGALLVTGGVGVQGSIYSKDGNPNENGLLYSPKVTVGDTTPVTAKVGDFWIDTTSLAEYQYIKDGTSTFWIQIAQL